MSLPLTPLTRTTRADIDLHLLHQRFPARYPYLLQTVALGTTGDQYDILFAFPGEQLVLDREYRLHSDSDTDCVVAEPAFLAAFDCVWRERRVNIADCGLPFSGGWFVYLGYELAQQIEPSLDLPRCDTALPVAFATRIPAAIIKDHSRQSIIVIAEPGHDEQFQQLCNDLDTVHLSMPARGENFANSSDSREVVDDNRINLATFDEDPAADYLEAVDRVKRYIRDGDVFQVNLSRQWRGELPAGADYQHLYRQLRDKNPAPFFGLATFADKAIISSSPERLVRVTGNRVETRPIAGTRPRSAIPLTDNDNRNELIAHPKERAEHIMLIDLERNDLGRLCKPGSVQVNELMVLESYAHVHHIVSNVCGELRNDVTPGQVINAVFPGGTITGCPKVRCMQIIAELEQTGRGAYTGSMGYINHTGSMDFNILIRTMVKDGNQLTIRAGAGIVADSIAQNELAETRSKARGLLLALGVDTIC